MVVGRSGTENFEGFVRVVRMQLLLTFQVVANEPTSNVHASLDDDDFCCFASELQKALVFLTMLWKLKVP
jgi:hypothetical protein